MISVRPLINRKGYVKIDDQINKYGEDYYVVSPIDFDIEKIEAVVRSKMSKGGVFYNPRTSKDFSRSSCGDSHYEWKEVEKRAGRIKWSARDVATTQLLWKCSWSRKEVIKENGDTSYEWVRTYGWQQVIVGYFVSFST